MNQVMLGKVLGSKYDDDGFLAIQVETFGTGGKSVGWFELSNSHGTQTRPADPDADGTACQAFYWYDGARGYAMLANDPRVQQLLPESQKGEVFYHGPTGAFIRFKLDGSISLFTTADNTPNGRSVAFIVGPTGLQFNFPFGTMTFDETGFRVRHNSGARIDLGSVGGLPAPLDALSSYVNIGAAIARVEGSAVSLGTRAGAAEPLAKALATITGLQALSTALDAVAAALTNIAAYPPVGAVAGTGITAAVTAIGVAQGAIAATVGTVPSLATAST